MKAQLKNTSERKLARIERELSKICFADVRELSAIVPDIVFEDGVLKANSIKSLANLPKSLAAAASSVKVKATSSALEVEIKLCDKFKALDMYRSILNENNGTSEHPFFVAYDYRRPDAPAARLENAELPKTSAD